MGWHGPTLGATQSAVVAATPLPWGACRVSGASWSPQEVSQLGYIVNICVETADKITVDEMK